MKTAGPMMDLGSSFAAPQMDMFSGGEFVEPVESEAEKNLRWEQAYKRFQAAQKNDVPFWDDIYDDCKKHDRFILLGRQFEDGELRRYKWKNPLMPNMVLTYLNHVANTALMQDYRATVTPNGGGATEDGARARQQILRGIQRDGADEVYNSANRQQLAGGIAYSQVLLEFANESGFEKSFRAHYIRDTYNVYPDKNVQTSTFHDSTRWSIREVVDKDMWAEKTGLEAGSWTPTSKEVWQFWEKTVTDDTETEMQDGQMVTKPALLGENALEQSDGSEAHFNRDGVTPYSRPVRSHSWTWYKIANGVVVDEVKWKGKESPIVATTGRRVETPDGKVRFQGIGVFAEEPQRMYTIVENIKALRMSRSPYSKWKVAFDSVMQSQIDEYIRSSRTGDTDAILWYAPFGANGQPIPQPEEIPAQLLDALLLQIQDRCMIQMQQIFGIFSANLGEKSNENSGIAVENRAKQGDVSNYDLRFNQIAAVRQVGTIIMNLIPRYMTAEQQVLFVDAEDNGAIGWINKSGDDASPKMDAAERYQLVVEVAPLAATEKAEEAQLLLSLLEKAPMIAQDPEMLSVVVAAQPGRHAKELAAMLRAKKQDPEKAQMQQMIQQLQQALAKAQDKTALEAEKLRIESKKNDEAHVTDTGKLAIEAANSETDRMKIGYTMDDEPVLPNFVAEHMKMDHEVNLQDADHAHELRMSQQQPPVAVEQGGEQ